MVPRRKATIQKNTAIVDGILTGRDTSYDNDNANTRHQDNTPEAPQRDSDPEAETTSTVEIKEQCHKGTFPTTTRGQRKRSRIHQDRRTNRNYAASRKASRNAGRVRARQRKQDTTCRTHAGIPGECRKTRRIYGEGATPILRASSVKSLSERRLGRRIASITHQNEDKYRNRKKAPTNAKTSA